MIKVSTKTGDKGKSGLISGERLPKSHPLFQTIGDIDELNSWLGLVGAKFGRNFAQQKNQIYQIQDTLFYLGAELAGSSKTMFNSAQVKNLEQYSDSLQLLMADDWHSKFLLPGGTVLGGYLDVTRTVCRRAERSTVYLSETRAIRPVVLRYLNRLSDFLYILRCYVNHSLDYSERKFNSHQ